jgi:hypothetical protein
VTIVLRGLALDEEALRGRNVGFTANSALYPLDQPCRRRARPGRPVGARLRVKTSSYSDLRTDPKLILAFGNPSQSTRR